MFKIGDWVVNTTHKEPKPFIWTKELNDSESTHNQGDHIQLWQPQEGEWCWWYSDKEKRPLLTTFNNAKFNQESYHDYSPEVEPFIGELPSFAKV